MTDCCQDTACSLEALRGRQSSVLRFVLVVNAVMFVVEMSAGVLAGSVALVADSLDMLGDALVYAFSLWVVARGALWKARAAAAKAGVMALFGLFAAVQVARKIVQPELPVHETIGVVGALALAANLWCFLALRRHRADDINMRSVWLCSRNDLFANTGVLAAAGLVAVTRSAWPDIVVGALICALFLRSAWSVARDARHELRTAARVGAERPAPETSA